MLGGMELPAGDTQPAQMRDRQLVQIMDAALADAARRAGAWLACKPGCTQCCHGAFAINALDVERLRAALQAADPAIMTALQERARAWIAEFGPDFPGDLKTGELGTSDEDQARFEDFANDAPCPALNPETGLCDVYEGRPMTCRVFGPPTPVEDGLGCCELCFVGANETEIAACEMPVPHELEERLLANMGDAGETVVAIALLRSGPQ